MLKTFIRTTACLALSATAFIVVTKMDATAAKPRSPSVPEASQPKPAPSKPAPTPPPPKLTVASVSPPPGAVPTTTAVKGKADRDAQVTLPDWKGKRLSVVQREARKLGITVTALDGTGDAVPSEEASDYRVRKQMTSAGTEVEPGTDVQLRVRMVVNAAMGY